jgi:hypothetical protein
MPVEEGNRGVTASEPEGPIRERAWPSQSGDGCVSRCPARIRRGTTYSPKVNPSSANSAMQASTTAGS